VPNLPQVAFLLPAFQKSAVISEVVEKILSLADRNHSFETSLLVVLDGPDQEALIALSSLQDSRVSVLQLPRNMGKGYALRSGAKLINGDVVVLFDADLDIAPESAMYGVQVILDDQVQQIGCAYGSKFHPNSRVSYPLARRILSRAFNRLVRVFCGLSVEDSQVGVKVLHQHIFKSVVNNCVEDRFLFDVELLHFVGQQGRLLVPIPVNLTHQFDSTINLIEIVRMARDLTRVVFRLRQLDNAFRRN
jgi:glycosyltransferase involved in cell wall biosynthesis